jgi:hypothetical protein
MLLSFWLWDNATGVSSSIWATVHQIAYHADPSGESIITRLLHKARQQV